MVSFKMITYMKNNCFLMMTLKWEFHEIHEKITMKVKKTHKNLISRWVRVTICYKLFSWSKILRTKIFHQNFLIKKLSSPDIWIDVFRKFCCDINKYNIFLVIVYFGECTWPVAFERTYLQGLTHSRSWDIWIDVHVVFRWFQPYLVCIFEYSRRRMQGNPA